MSGLAKHFGWKCAAAAVLLGLVSGPALAQEYEVRMPVEKTARIAPLGEATAEPGKAAQPEKPAKPAKQAKPDTKSDAKPDAKPEAKPAAKPEKPADKADAPVKVKRLDPEAAKPVAKPAAKPAVKPAAKAAAKPEVTTEAAQDAKPAAAAEAPAPAPKPAPRPKPAPPAPRLDPKAQEWPAGPITQEPRAAALPPAESGGQWAGDVSLEFHEDAVVLHVATNALAERVTWFNLAGPAEPRKLALDLRGAWRKKGAAVLRSDSGPVKAVVAGEHPDRLRLSIEFRDGAVAPEVEPKIESDPRGLSVTIPLAVRLKR